MYRRRFSYWSESKFSKWLRTKTGLENPFALTMEDWNHHEKECKQKAPFVHWFTDVFLNKLQNVVYYVPDVWWNIKTATIWKFFRNLWVFRKALWNYVSWDFYGLLRFMEEASRDMSRCHRDHGHLLRSEQTAKELLIFAELCKRIREDEYDLERLNYIPPKAGRKLFGNFVNKPNTLPNYKATKEYYRLTNEMKKNDLKLLGKLIERKLLCWWD